MMLFFFIGVTKKKGVGAVRGRSKRQGIGRRREEGEEGK
jgi:hypothetical protein